jgi:hypothetical protein
MPQKPKPGDASKTMNEPIFKLKLEDETPFSEGKREELELIVSKSKGNTAYYRRPDGSEVKYGLREGVLVYIPF